MKLTLVSQSEDEINLDASNPVIIGRGSLFGCFDKKVSRNHGRIQLTSEGNVHLLALHTNPCFFMRNGVPPVLQLMKNEENILKDGDYIGLLPDSFWYKIVIKENEVCNPSKSSDDVSVNLFDDASAVGENIVELGKIKSVSIVEKLESNVVNEDNVKSPVQDLGNNVPGKTGLSSSISEKRNELEKTRKLPIWEYEIDAFPEEVNKTNLNEIPASNSELEEKEEKIDLRSDGRTVVFPTQTACNDEPLSSCVQSSSTVDDCENLSSNEVKKCSEVNRKECITHTAENSTDEQTQNDANISEINTTIKRPFCQYEVKCYRKNEQHRKNFSHPGDSDFIPYLNRPFCQYGSSCYRRNKNHHVEFQHPKKCLIRNPMTNFSVSPKQKRPKKNERRRDSYSEEDEDDYDFDDPFIDDGSSDEYIPSDLDSEDDNGVYVP